MNRRFALLGFVLAALTFSAKAQTEIHYTAAQQVDPAVVAQILSAHAPKVVKTRSLRLLDDAAPTVQAAPESPSSLSIPVRFAFDSADILPEARAQLDAIAEGIKLLPPAQSVVIEGHTDATGSDSYNLSLSQRRAESVRTYLVRVHGIDANRLAPAGFGKYRPIAGIDPFAAENRRVQFRGG
jgi:outer membrane protein OmpA-like peptidoglycan-associated protein